MNPNTDPNKPERIGLALSGGGIRGVSHVGIMQALTDHGIRFSHISGTSAGAMVGSFFAAGYSPKEILGIIKKTNPFRLLRPAFGSMGLLSILHVQQLIREYIPHNSFSQLKIKLTTTAVDLGEGKLDYFTDGDLDLAVLASCCLPGIFKPVMINGHIFIDGGVLNNFPVEPLIGNCDFIIGSSCNHLPHVAKLGSFTDIVDRAAMIAINANLNHHKISCDVVLEPHGLGGYGIFDTDKAEEIYLIGYEEGLKAINSNEKLKSIVEANNKKKGKPKA